VIDYFKKENPTIKYEPKGKDLCRHCSLIREFINGDKELSDENLKEVADHCSEALAGGPFGPCEHW
jgi:hypothetical protein